MRLVAQLVTLGAVMTLISCDLKSETFEYPDVLDLEFVTVNDLRTSSTVPGRYNVTAVVVHISDCSCPADALCIPCQYPEGIIVSETGEPVPESGYHSATTDFLLIEATDSEQFINGIRYSFSVEVSSTRTDLQPVSVSRLLGYRRIN